MLIAAMNVAVVIPAFNEAKTISDVVRGVGAVTPDVFVVDDGSTDATARLAREAGARVLRHVVNRGLGGALGTGIRAALEHGAEYVVTFDGDGQHDAKDIPRVLAPLQLRQADVVVGSRLLGQASEKERMPFLRRLYNGVGNRITLLMFGIRTSDSQSGLRAFTRQAAATLDLRSNRMEVSTEIMYEVHRHQFRLREVSITPIYTEYSMSKGQSLSVGIKTFFRLVLLRLLK